MRIAVARGARSAEIAESAPRQSFANFISLEISSISDKSRDILAAEQQLLIRRRCD